MKIKGGNKYDEPQSSRSCFEIEKNASAFEGGACEKVSKNRKRSRIQTVKEEKQNEEYKVVTEAEARSELPAPWCEFSLDAEVFRCDEKDKEISEDEINGGDVMGRKRNQSMTPESAVNMGVGMGVGIGVMGAGMGVASGAVAGLPAGPAKSMMGMAPLMMAGMAVGATAKMGKKKKSMW